MDLNWLRSQLKELQDELEDTGLTEMWLVRKRLAFTVVRGYTVQMDYEKAKAKNPGIRIEYLEQDKPWTKEDKAAIKEIILIRRAIMKRAAELKKQQKQA